MAAEPPDPTRSNRNVLAGSRFKKGLFDLKINCSFAKIILLIPQYENVRKISRVFKNVKYFRRVYYNLPLNLSIPPPPFSSISSRAFALLAPRGGDLDPRFGIVGTCSGNKSIITFEPVVKGVSVPRKERRCVTFLTGGIEDTPLLLAPRRSVQCASEITVVVFARFRTAWAGLAATCII